MIEKKFLSCMFLCTIFLFTLIVPARVFAEKNLINAQDNTQGNTQEEQAQTAMDMMAQVYESLVKEFDKTEIEKCEVQIQKAIAGYIKGCVLDKSYINNSRAIQNIELEANNLLQYFKSVATGTDAYLASHVVFVINWSSIVNQMGESLKNSQEEENFQEAIEQIQSLVERLFIQPMEKLQTSQLE